MANRVDKFAKSIHGTNPLVRGRGGRWGGCRRPGAQPRWSAARCRPLLLAAAAAQQEPRALPPSSPAATHALPCFPQNLVEKITRNKIQASNYWKERCFGLSAESMIDRAVELKCIGGMYGEPNKPSDFICLILKMLQIQPDFDIVVELIRNEDYKYVRLLGE